MGPAYIGNVSGQDGDRSRGGPRTSRRSIVVGIAGTERRVTCFLLRKHKSIEPILVASLDARSSVRIFFVLAECVVCTPFFLRDGIVILLVVVVLIDNPEASCFAHWGRALQPEINVSGCKVQVLFPGRTISVYVQEQGSGRFVAP